MEHLLDSKGRAKALAEGQIKARERRIMEGRKKGRPIKNSGVYYCKHVLLDPETYEYIVKNKYQHSEPLGSVVHRLLSEKKVSGQSNAGRLEQPLDSTTYRTIWRILDTKQ
jgi:hypothetical protein